MSPEEVFDSATVALDAIIAALPVMLPVLVGLVVLPVVVRLAAAFFVRVAQADEIEEDGGGTPPERPAPVGVQGTAPDRQPTGSLVDLFRRF